MRVGFLSDLHITNNTTFLAHAAQGVLKIAKENKIDKLFLAGDTANDYQLTLDFAEELTKEGLETYTIFGNHEYWSLSHDEAKEINSNHYINGKTIKLTDDIVVVGIDGFFDYSFITEVDNEFTKEIDKDRKAITDIGKMSFDLTRLKTPEDQYEIVFENMLKTLESELKANKGKQIIVIMHHVPHKDFLIYSKDKIWTANNAFMGSQRFHDLFVEYEVDKVFFGHTHQVNNDIKDGIEYYCNPIGYRYYEFTETFQKRVNKMLKIVEI